MSGNGDLTLTRVNFESSANGWLHAPAQFTGQVGSHAEIIGNEGIKVSGSFSWIGAMSRKATGDGALFEWDDGSKPGTHIWIWKNKLYVNVIYEPRCYHSMFYNTPVANDKSYVFAVSFNMDTKMISLWVDGKKEEKSGAGCSNVLMPANNVRVSKRYVICKIQ